jgi:hypothetical protein
MFYRRNQSIGNGVPASESQREYAAQQEKPSNFWPFLHQYKSEAHSQQSERNWHEHHAYDFLEVKKNNAHCAISLIMSF